MSPIAAWTALIAMKTDVFLDPAMDTVLDIAGVLIGDFIMNLLETPNVTNLNLYRILASALGARAIIWSGKATCRTS